ncbi:ABC transporter substrate-binding protein [Cryptosporangium sp. NPDC051539]|uniref:ABC transporter substrate-binding protein n=1 Tax=Cryptosporangium sp. NPDC051539 TaxID=3363962 RepID=UPI0037BAF300
MADRSPQALGRRRFLGLAAGGAAAVGFSAAGCSPSVGGSSSSSSANVLRIATSDGNTNDSYDPLRLERAMQILTACLMYESLVDFDDRMQPVGRLAESFRTEDDGTTWTFTLRDGVTFHDGKPLTPADVIYSITRALDPNEGSGNSLAGQLKGILRAGGMTAPDARTVKFSLDTKYVFFPGAMATRFARIYRAGTTSFDEPVGTGPFAFASFKAGQSFEAKRFAGYWGEAPAIEQVSVINYPNESTRLSALIDGDVDLMFEVAAAAAADITGADGLRILEQKSATWIPLALDTTVAPFDDPKVVKAMKLAIDRKKVVEVGLGGYGTVGYDTPIPADDASFAGLPEPARDLARARSLLASAGHAKGLTLPRLTCLDQASATSMALVIQQQLAEIGVKFEIARESAATYWDDSWLKKPFYSNDYQRRTPDEILKLAFTSDGAWNMSKQSDPQLDAAVAAAASTTDVREQKRQYAVAQRLIAQRNSTIVSAQLSRLSGISDRVRGVTTNPVFWLDLRKASVSS